MATGRLNQDGTPVIDIRVVGQLVEAVIDTGMEGGLQLPLSFQPLLAPLRPHGRITYQLGVGQQAVVLTYQVFVEVGSETVATEAFFSPSDEVLLGLDVLKHFRLTIDFPAGTVELAR